MNTWMIGKYSVKHHYHIKKIFFNCLNMKGITDADYTHAKIVCKKFEINNLVEYHYLYVQIDTLLLASVFNNFRNMFHEIYGIVLVH